MLLKQPIIRMSEAKSVTMGQEWIRYVIGGMKVAERFVGLISKGGTGRKIERETFIF